MSFMDDPYNEKNMSILAKNLLFARFLGEKQGKNITGALVL